MIAATIGVRRVRLSIQDLRSSFQRPVIYSAIPNVSLHYAVEDLVGMVKLLGEAACAC